MAKEININESIYDFQEELLKIGVTYLKSEDGSQLNTEILKTGLFGWLVESLSVMNANSIFFKTALEDEKHLNTMKFPKSIFNECALHNYNPSFVNPAYTVVGLLLEVDNLDIEFTISKDTIFNDGEFDYTLPATIEYKNGKAHYNISKRNFLTLGDFTIPSENIKTMPRVINGKNYIYLEIHLVQATIKTLEFRVPTIDYSKNIYFNVNYENQIAGFNIKYLKNSSETFDIEPVYGLLINTNNEYTCLYNYVDLNNFDLIFPVLTGSFTPIAGSLINVELFETSGYKANSVDTKVFNTNLELLTSDNQILTPNTVECHTVTDIIGGGRALSLSEIKKEILYKKRSLDTINTDWDIQNYLNSILNSNVTLNNNRIIIKKIRDDILKRVFRTYILLRDKNNNIIPSYTTDIKIDKLITDNENNIEFIPAGSYVIHDKRSVTQNENLENYVSTSPFFIHDSSIHDDINVYINDKENFYTYKTLYAITLRLRPFLKTTYYKTSLNKNIPVELYNSNSSYNYIINKINITHTELEENNEYNFIFGMVANTEDPFTPYIVVRDEKNDILFKIQCNEITDGIYKGSIQMSDKFSNYDEYLIESGALNESNTAITNSVVLPRKAILEISIEENSSMTIFSGREQVEFYKNLDNILTSSVTINNSDGKYIIKEVPLIKASYLNDSEKYLDLIQQTSELELLLKTALLRLESNNEFDFKFYNTYGPSKYYNLNTLQISLNLSITTLYTITDDTKAQIREFIINFINNTAILKKFNISNLTTALENRFKEIENILITSINGNSQIQNIYQVLEYDYENLEQSINVPEYINIQGNDLTIKFK